MPAGRPSKYDPKYCEEVVQFMKDNDGAALVEFAAHIGIAKSSIYKWQDEHPEFSDACERAMQISESWWVQQGREALHRDERGNTKIDTNLYKFKMSARFGYSEKQRVESDNVTQNTVVLGYNLEDDDDK